MLLLVYEFSGLILVYFMHTLITMLGRRTPVYTSSLFPRPTAAQGRNSCLKAGSLSYGASHRSLPPLGPHFSIPVRTTLAHALLACLWRFCIWRRDRVRGLFFLVLRMRGSLTEGGCVLGGAAVCWALAACAYWLRRTCWAGWRGTSRTACPSAPVRCHTSSSGDSCRTW